MTDNEQHGQMTLAEVRQLSRSDPEAVVEALNSGRLSDLMSGKVCSSCGQPIPEPPSAA